MGRTVGRNAVEEMAGYILGGNHEYESCLENVRDFIKWEERRPNKSTQRRQVENHIWYVAYKARHGAREANKAVTELLKEV